MDELALDLTFSQDCIWRVKGLSEDKAKTPERQLIVDFLNQNKGTDFQVKEIADNLNLNPHDVSALVNALNNEGFVEKVKYGVWRAKDLTFLTY